jgi:hypothetical protein
MIDGDVCGTVGGMRIGRENRSTRRKPAPVPFCIPQIPHDLTWARTRGAAVGSRRITAWVMARRWPVLRIQPSALWHHLFWHISTNFSRELMCTTLHDIACIRQWYDILSCLLCVWTSRMSPDNSYLYKLFMRTFSYNVVNWDIYLILHKV